MFITLCVAVYLGGSELSPWWRHQMETFLALLAIYAKNSPVPAWMFSLICVWINGWVNNRKAGDLRRYRAHYDVNVMVKIKLSQVNQENWNLFH